MYFHIVSNGTLILIYYPHDGNDAYGGLIILTNNVILFDFINKINCKFFLFQHMIENGYYDEGGLIDYRLCNCLSIICLISQQRYAYYCINYMLNTLITI